MGTVYGKQGRLGRGVHKSVAGPRRGTLTTTVLASTFNLGPLLAAQNGLESRTGVPATRVVDQAPDRLRQEEAANYTRRH